MSKSERKNKPGDRIDYNTFPNQEKRINPSKKSRIDEPQAFETSTDDLAISRRNYFYT